MQTIQPCALSTTYVEPANVYRGLTQVKRAVAAGGYRRPMISQDSFFFDAYSTREVAARVDAVCVANAGRPLLPVMAGLLPVGAFGGSSGGAE